MKNPTEFFLLFTCGFALYEYGVRRYFLMMEKEWWEQGVVLLLIEFAMTIKYAGMAALALQISFVSAYILIVLLIPVKESKDRRLVEKFALRNGLLALLLVIVYRVSSGAAVNSLFDAVWNASFGIQIENVASLLMYSIGYLFVLDGGTTIVRGLLNKVPIITQKALSSHGENSGTSTQQKGETEETVELKNAGELIGIIERLLIVTFVLSGSYEAVAFSFAAKSIARYKELDDKNFAEYYLLGTTASVIIAVVVGMLVRGM